MKHIRFEKKLPYVATEVDIHSRSIADVLYFTKADLCTEIEVKISKADFLKELKKTKKHTAYASSSLVTPNYFVIATTEELRKFAIKHSPEYAGIIIVGKSVEYVRQPKLIHSEKLLKLKNKLVLRATSELCNLRLKFLS